MGLVQLTIVPAWCLRHAPLATCTAVAAGSAPRRQHQRQHPKQTRLCMGSCAGAAVTRSVGLQTLLIAAGGWMALGLLVLYQTYAHGDEEEASQSGQSSSKPEQGCDLQVDRTPSLTSSLGRPPSGAPTHDTSPRKGDDEASLAGKRPLSPRRGIPEDPRGSDELDEIISMAAARYDAQMGPGSSSPILEAPSPPPASSKVGGVAREAGHWDETLDLYVLVQPAPPFAILEASSDWLGFYGFAAAEVVGSPLCRWSGLGLGLV